MQFPRIFRRTPSLSYEASSAVLPDNSSSSPTNINGSTGSVIQGDSIIYYPTPSFSDRYDAYETIGRVFSAVETVVKAVNKRDFYFANTDENSKDTSKIKKMEQWERDYNGSKFIENLVRTWLKAGTAIIGPDFQFVPMTTIWYMRTDLYGKLQEIVLNIAGRYWPLGATMNANGSFQQTIPIEDYIVSHYIHDNRDAWGKNLYYPICSTFNDIDGKQSTQLYKGFRQMEQDGIRMHHRLAAQKSIWIFPKLTNPSELNVTNPKSLAYRIFNMRPGDSLVGGKDFEGASRLTDQLDGRTRFPEVTDLIKGEVEVTSQSSAARLIEDPSAMADARAAQDSDDDTTLYVCELVRRLFDYVIIPKVIGDNSVEFKWGTADSFDFNFTEMLQAVQAGIISIEEAREQMKSAGRRLDDSKFTPPPPATAAIHDATTGKVTSGQEPTPAQTQQDSGQAAELLKLKKKAYQTVIDKLEKGS